MKLTSNVVAVIAASLILAGCGGGGGGGGGNQPARPAGPLAFPFAAGSNQHYDTTWLPDIRAADVRHMPVYHDGSYRPDGGYPFGEQARNRRLFVGVDQGDAVGALPRTGARGEIEIRHGRLNDGAGRQAVLDYLSYVSSLRFSQAPTVRVGGSATDRDHQIAAAAVQVVNQALPEEMKITVGTPLQGQQLQNRDGVISVLFVDEPADYGGISHPNFGRGQIDGGVIRMHKGPDGHYYHDDTDRRAVILLAHELLHSLGLSAHPPDSFDTILEETADIYDLYQGKSQPLSLLYPIDREVLRAYYQSINCPCHDGVSSGPQSLGPWASTSTHVHGNGPHAGFGVALRNGYAEPWAYGYLPGRDLADNRGLSGDVAWTGSLLGLTPGAEAVAGDAAITVDLDTLAGRADFTALESWAAGAAPGDAGTGTTWRDGDLGYSIAVRGNTFRETGGDAGRLSGIFVGASHEGAAGTLERADLTAAFGADRGE